MQPEEFQLLVILFWMIRNGTENLRLNYYIGIVIVIVGFSVLSLVIFISWRIDRKNMSYVIEKQEKLISYYRGEDFKTRFKKWQKRNLKGENTK